MINVLGRFALNFIIVILVQVLIINNLDLGLHINPFLYILVLITLPVEIPNWVLMILGFFIGLLMDAFLNTIGMHASASVFLCYLRPYLLRFFAPRDGYEPGSLPTPAHFGFSWFLKYAMITVVLHHAFLFFVEAFTFDNFFTTLGKIILSSIFTIFIIMIAQLFGQKKERRI